MKPLNKNLDRAKSATLSSGLLLNPLSFFPMNEFLFAFHILIVAAFIFASLRLGKNALIAMAALQAILANLFVTKQMVFFGMTITCSDVFSIGGILALNLLQEYFGKDAAVKAIRISFLSLLFFVSMAQIHLFYTPAASDQTQGAFQTIFSATPRIVFASVAVFYLVQKIDLRLFGWLKQFFEGRKLPWRMGISLFFSQFIDTVLFSFAGLYGIVESVGSIILVSLAAKYLIISCSSALVVFAKRFAPIEKEAA